MQGQQTQKLETTLLLFNQDLQVRQGNSSGPKPAHLWEGGTCWNNATENQNRWKRGGRSGECHLNSRGQLEWHHGEIHSGATSGLLLSRPHWDISLSLASSSWRREHGVPRAHGVLRQLLITALAPHRHFTSPSLHYPQHSPQQLLHRCQETSTSFILSVASTPTLHGLNHHPSC